MGKRKGSVSRHAVNDETRDSIALRVKHRRRGAVAEIEEDRLSELPDEILSSILSAMPVREAVRARILSSRWRYLRPSLDPNLSLDVYTMHGFSYYDEDEYLWYPNEPAKREERRCRFVGSVNQFLQLYSVQKIKTFGINFYLNNKYSNHLDQWINFAITSGTEELYLDLTYNGYHGHNLYTFPFGFLGSSKESSLKNLELVACKFRYNDFEGFSSLKSLNLTYVKVGDNDIVNLLSKCPYLERLCIECCKHFVDLKIAGPSLQLKYLKLDLDFPYMPKKIEIRAQNLHTFEYSGGLTAFSIGCVPNLVNVMVNFYLLGGIIPSFSRLPAHLYRQIQFLAIATDKEVFTPDDVSRLTKLEHLLLHVMYHQEEDLLLWTSIIKGCPLLQKFHVHMDDYYEPKYYRGGKISRPQLCPNHHLKEVELSKFSGKKAEVELAIYILKNAIALESMTIDTRNKYYEGGRRWVIIKGPPNEKWLTRRLARVVQLLNQEVRPNVKLVIL
ncbi:putative F-box/LRR-repeat protein At5g54820 [Tasmannia lanceolata]|uniref:putative F-box/LRR-repeat protein At5g54820 n=1 Tax=Tasmannia lanceolata TaxID=3420 RepID=UPI004062F760